MSHCPKGSLMNEVTYMPRIDISPIILGLKVHLMGKGITLRANHGVSETSRIYPFIFIVCII